MNKRYNYRFTAHYDNSQPDCNLSVESNHIVTDGEYTFEDFIKEQVIPGADEISANNGEYIQHDYEIEENGWGTCYFLTDAETGERTGEAYVVTDEFDTDEDIT